jgi:hypothetical protein
MAAELPAWLYSLRRFAFASVVGHFAWEVLQLPLYTIWHKGTTSEIVFAVAHCSGGDLVVTSVALVLSLLLLGRDWPADAVAYRTVTVAFVAFGVGYAIFSEWLNVSVRQSWAYSAWMPQLPPLGTGLSPLAQWIVVPLVSFWWARPTPGH